jgi:hypothetical protein
VEDGSFQIFSEGYLSPLEGRNHQFVPRLEILVIQLKVLQGLGAFRVVPGVAEQNSTHIPKNGTNVRHAIPPEDWPCVASLLDDDFDPARRNFNLKPTNQNRRSGIPISLLELTEAAANAGPRLLLSLSGTHGLL